MKSVIAFIAMLVPLTAFCRPSPPAEAPPIPMETSRTKKQWDTALGECEKSVFGVDGNILKYRVKKYCRCFVQKSERVLPHNAKNVSREKIVEALRPIVDWCFAKHIAPWYRQRFVPQSEPGQKKNSS